MSRECLRLQTWSEGDGEHLAECKKKWQVELTNKSGRDGNNNCDVGSESCSEETEKPLEAAVKAYYRIWITFRKEDANVGIVIDFIYCEYSNCGSSFVCHLWPNTLRTSRKRRRRRGGALYLHVMVLLIKSCLRIFPQRERRRCRWRRLAGNRKSPLTCADIINTLSNQVPAG